MPCNDDTPRNNELFGQIISLLLLFPLLLLLLLLLAILLLLLLLLKAFFLRLAYIFRPWSGRCPVTSMELAILSGLLIGCTALIILAQFKFAQMTASQLAARISQLDAALGEAVTGVLEGGMGSFEPPNPLVNLLTQYMASQLNPAITDVSLSRADNGTFVKKFE